MVLEKKKESMITAFQHEIGKEAFIVKRSWGAEKQRYFLSRERQLIFQKICEFPCSTISRLGCDLSLSPSGIRWHLEKLSKGGFVNKRSINGRWIYYPVDMLTDEDIQILSIIQGSVAGNLLRQLIKDPGLSQKEISGILKIKLTSLNSNLKMLENTALITHIIDGKFKRYYVTDKIIRMYSSKKKKIGVFRDNLLIKLKREMYSIDILLSTPQKLSIKLSTGLKNTILTIPVNPYEKFFIQ